jgi:tetratricopeptide (TPR) repeat protein
MQSIKNKSGFRAAFFFALSLAWGSSFASAPKVSADEFLEKLDVALAEDPKNLQNLFTRGMLLSNLGRLSEASDAFRQMLSIDPNLLRPRLELARVLAEAKDYEAAKYHFEQVLSSDLPEMVRLNIRGYLNKIREEVPTYSLTVELVSDSNPKKATESEEISINGLTFRLNQDARAESAWGMRITGDGKIPLPDNPLWFLHLAGEHQEFDGHDLDFTSLRASAGHHLRFEDHTVTAELGHHWARYQDESLYDGLAWTLSDFRPLKPNLALRLGVTGLELKYPNYSYRDGWQHIFETKLIYAPSLTSRWEADAALIYSEAEEDAYSFRQPQIALRYVHEWEDGWITGLSGTYSETRYQAADPLFQVKRNESEQRLELDIANRKFRLWDVTPRLHLGWTKHDANIDFYSWDRGFVRLGFTGEF